jgi:hypothetical protein
MELKELKELIEKKEKEISKILWFIFALTKERGYEKIGEDDNDVIKYLENFGGFIFRIRFKRDTGELRKATIWYNSYEKEVFSASICSGQLFVNTLDDSVELQETLKDVMNRKKEIAQEIDNEKERLRKQYEQEAQEQQEMKKLLLRAKQLKIEVPQ